METRNIELISTTIDNRMNGRERSLETPSTDFEALIASSFFSGQIGFEQALEIPEFAASLAFICDTVAMLPIRLYREKDGKTELIRDDKRVRLLNDDTGGLLDPYQSRRQFVEDYFRRGAGYIYIDRYKGDVSRLLYVDADNVGVMTNADPIFLDGVLQVSGKNYEPFDFLKICRRTKDGLKGRSIIDDNNVLLSSAYYLLKYGLKNSKNGGKRRGVLQSENKLGAAEIEKLKLAWQNMYTSDGDTALVLNNGVKFNEISQTAVEQQLSQQRKEINEGICAIFGLNAAVISSKASDDERIAAIKTAIMPILTAFVKSANKELLLESEKYSEDGEMYFEFDLSETMKADMLKRFQAYEIALRSKWLQPDEVRYLEDRDPLGLDFITLGLEDVLYDPKTKTVYTPNTNQTVKLGEGGVKLGEERYNHNHGADGKFTFSSHVDVTAEYEKSATPGVGTIVRDDDYNAEANKNEIQFADWMHNNLGGNIRLIKRSEIDNVKSPDYEWKGKLWDLKQPESETGANSAVRKGIKQIKDNPGGVILDYRNKNISIDNLVKVIDKRMKWYSQIQIDVMIVHKNKLCKVLRYN